MNVLIPCMITTAILAFAWITITGTAGLVAFCFLYGLVSKSLRSHLLLTNWRLFSGSFVSLPATICFMLCPSLSVVGVRSGMLFMPIGFGLLIGNPIAGSLLERGWISLQVFCGVFILAACGFVMMARISKAGTQFIAII